MSDRVDSVKGEALGRQMVGLLNKAFLGIPVSIGHRTSLFDVSVVLGLLFGSVSCRPVPHARSTSIAARPEASTMTRQDTRPSAEELKSKEEVAAFMRRAYRQAADSRLQELEELIAADAFILGSGPEGGFSSRAAWQRSLQPQLAQLPSGASYEVTSKDLRVGLASGLRSAWVSDQLEIRPAGAAPSPTFSLRILVLLSCDDGRWQIVAGHGSFPIPNPAAHRMIRSGQLDRSASLGDGIQPGAEALARLYESGMAAPGSLEETISDRPDVIAFGSAAHEVHEGGAALKTAWHQFLAIRPRLTTIGGIRAGLSPDGALGWVASNVDIQIDELRMPYRFFLVYLKETSRWTIVGWHDSYGLPDPP